MDLHKSPPVPFRSRQNNTISILWVSILALLILALSAVYAPAPAGAMQVSTPTVAPAATIPAPAAYPPLPVLPVPVAVQVDPKTTAYLVLDLTSTICAPRASCVSSLPAAAALLKKAREAQALVVYSDTGGNSAVLSEVAAAANDPKVSGGADKFFQTNLDDLLKSKGIKTAVMVGSAANGAILYTAFAANLRGYTVVVAEDGISSSEAFAVLLTRYQLLNQPGMSNPSNAPLVEGRVTLSRSDLIAFVPGAAGPRPAATTVPVSAQPTAAATGAGLPSAATQPAASASTLGTNVPASAQTCLGCHPYDKVFQGTANYKTFEGYQVNPHVSVDPIKKEQTMPNPHTSGKTIVDCTKCHKPHALPLAQKDMAEPSMDYCYTCHHTTNYQPCSKCH